MRNVSTSSKDYVRSILVGALLGITIALIFAAGFFFRDIVGLSSVRAFAGEDEGSGYPLLDEVQTLLDLHFLRAQPDATQRQYAAIRGMLGSLQDRYTFFIDPPVAQSESDVLAGTYGGIGVQIQRSEDGRLLLFPFADSSAFAAGIEHGDELIAINGAPVDLSQPQDVIDQSLRGEVKEGSGVEITVIKADNGEEFTAFVPFAVVNVPSVVWRTLQEDAQLGYIQVMRFTARTPEEVKQAVEELRAANVKALVLDLRNNSGGLLQESIWVADEFVDTGTLVYEQDKQGETTYEAQAGGVALDLPMAVLVNQGTASGAELVAGALQDYERGILIGQTTYGKGTIQQIYPLSDGSSLHVTSAEWFTPDRHQLSDIGLTPQIVIAPDPSGRDVELAEAVRHLQQTLQSSG